MNSLKTTADSQKTLDLATATTGKRAGVRAWAAKLFGKANRVFHKKANGDSLAAISLATGSDLVEDELAPSEHPSTIEFSDTTDENEQDHDSEDDEELPIRNYEGTNGAIYTVLV